jgi:hypothetical protein
MALARKGLRRVTVDDVKYEWAIRKKPTYVQGAFTTPMTIAIQRADADDGCVLLVNARISRPDNWIAPHQTSVTPRMVRAMISGALAEGWLPLQSGSAFRFDFALIMERA